MRILAIDPGPEQSGWALYDSTVGLPQEWEKQDNHDVLHRIDWASAEVMAVEMIASYGMAVSASVFDTCVWIGRFEERWDTRPSPGDSLRVFRKDVKMHLCGSMRAKDANIRQALIDRYGGKEKAIGRKMLPGPLYGMAGDCWSALAVAITAAETT